MKYLPIIYVRGYAGSDKDVEQTVEDPFYGFNHGSAHIRVGAEGNPEQYIFESPLLRLITDHGYRPVFEHNQEQQLRNNWKSISIYRFYDQTTESFGSETTIRLSMEEVAEGLRELIKNVKSQTGANKVYLVAHSMGGLVCRSLIQKIYPENNEKALDHIDKFFTYGTPHGGIHFDVGRGLIEKIIDTLRLNNMDDFGPRRMYEYLTPQRQKKFLLPEKFDVQSLNNSFPVDRVFCIIGTNASDYEEGFGLTQKVVGAQSDGLVQIDKAYVRGSHRAYIYRTHGGRYGMVNSEEAYQNLQRFLFGDIKVKLSLFGVELSDRQNTFYQMEVRSALRGLPVAIHEQNIDHYCPITLELTRDKPIPLFTAFMIPSYSAKSDSSCRYAIKLALHSFVKEKRNWLFGNHIDQLPLWSDYLIVDVKVVDGAYRAKYTWNTDEEPNISINPNPQEDTFVADIPLPERGQKALGNEAKVHLEIFLWS
ncbi:alpha/beta hydrolase [Nodularia harveyana UHCC-0300]|uniref:Alpha/beta hydrolase n=1 Tax=Nodularia harveyana UHCC-0300 TaxID=2974287 RepID=A0ABU5UGC1_9CYAN|nr:alpha/beta hydrolase [Nodularia harveyana]MEA5582597.1 alpha/beta hydrolase [Nodularia harveyana UHCC-0300]